MSMPSAGYGLCSGATAANAIRLPGFLVFFLLVALLSSGCVFRTVSRRNAEAGLWRPFDFLFDVRAGVYFLEAYDPDKIPVLFVHGINGTPRDFGYLIGRLDRQRFQAWMVYYPSGVRLAAVADFLDKLMLKLQAMHDFRRFLVVAHSMGGLVSRDFILKHRAGTSRYDIPVFVSISTPWNGHAAARMGVDHAPAVVRSWRDLVPGSAYLNEIFYEDLERKTVRRRIGESIRHHLLFGFRRNELLPGGSADGTVSVDSQLRPEAQAEAMRIYGFNETHTSILGNPDVATLLNEILLHPASR